jgi:hypothetical protein
LFAAPILKLHSHNAATIAVWLDWIGLDWTLASRNLFFFSVLTDICSFWGNFAYFTDFLILLVMVLFFIWLACTIILCENQS